MKVLANYTFSVEFSNAVLFEELLKKEVLPFLKKNESIQNVKLFRLLTEIHSDGQNISLQLFFKSKERVALFIQEFENEMLAILEPSFSGKYVYFQTTLEEF